MVRDRVATGFASRGLCFVFVCFLDPRQRSGAWNLFIYFLVFISTCHFRVRYGAAGVAVFGASLNFFFSNFIERLLLFSSAEMNDQWESFFFLIQTEFYRVFNRVTHRHAFSNTFSETSRESSGTFLPSFSCFTECFVFFQYWLGFFFDDSAVVYPLRPVFFVYFLVFYFILILFLHFFVSFVSARDAVAGGGA